MYLIKEGGEGSGNFGHEGRPGQIGGSGKGRKWVNSKDLNGNEIPQPKYIEELGISYANFSREFKPSDLTRKKFGLSEIKKSISGIPSEHLTKLGDNPDGLLITVYDKLTGTKVGNYDAEVDTIAVGVKGRSIYAIAPTLRHELGHRVQHIYGLINNREWAGIADRIAQNGNVPNQRFFYPIEVWHGTHTSSNPVFENSEQAKKRGRKEIFAECYSHYYGPNREDMPPEALAFFRKTFK